MRGSFFYCRFVRVGRKNYFFNFMVFNNLQAKIKQSIPIINIKKKRIVIKKTLKLVKIQKAKKNRTKVCNPTKMTSDGTCQRVS